MNAIKLELADGRQVTGRGVLNVVPPPGLSYRELVGMVVEINGATYLVKGVDGPTLAGEVGHRVRIYV